MDHIVYFTCLIFFHASLVQASQHESPVVKQVHGTSSNGTVVKQQTYEPRNIDKVPCIYTIAPNSAGKFTELINDKNVNFMYLKANFSRKIEVAPERRNRMFSPGYLVWTFKSSPGAGYPLLSYPYDVKILSLGFLTWHVYDYLQIHIDVGPDGCNDKWGDKDTMERLLSTLRTLSNQTKHAQTSSWCYGIKFQFDGMNNIIVRWLRRDFTGYMCSTSPESPTQFNRVVQETAFLIFLQICGVILLCYSPLLLYLLDKTSNNENAKTDETDDVREKSYPMVSAGDAADSNGGCDCRKDTPDIRDELDKYHFNGDTPISLLDPFDGFGEFVDRIKKRCTCSDPWPSIIKYTIRCITRLSFLIIIVPIVIYIRMIVYYVLLRKGVLARIEQDIPVGFLAIPFGFEASRRNWSYVMGGPYIIYGLFFVLTGVIFCVTSDFSGTLCARLKSLPLKNKGLPVDLETKGDYKLTPVMNESFLKPGPFNLLESLHSAYIENLGGIEYTKPKNHSFEKFTKALYARFYMLLNYIFWQHFFKTWFKRLIIIKSDNPGCCRWVVFGVLIIPWSVLCFVALILEFFVCLLFYGVPIIYLTKTLFVNFLHKSLTKPLDMIYECFGIDTIQQDENPGDQKNENDQKDQKKTPVRMSPDTPLGKKVLVWLIISPIVIPMSAIFIFILFCFYNIYAATTGYMYQTIVFTFIGIVAHPAEAATYIALVGAICAYIWKAIDHFEGRYTKLLERIIELSERMETKKQLKSDYPRYVVYNNNDPGIRRGLYDYLVGMHRPIRVEVFLSVLYLCVVISFVWLGINVVQMYNQMSELDGIIQLVSSVVFGFIPQLIELGLRSKPQREGETSQFDELLETSIQRYWDEMNKTSKKTSLPNDGNGNNSPPTVGSENDSPLNENHTINLPLSEESTTDELK